MQHDFHGKVSRRRRLRLDHRVAPATVATRATRAPTKESREEELRRAVARENIERVRELVDAAVNVNAADDLGRTAAHFAATKGNVAMINFLVESGASVSSVDRQGNAPLHLAACTNHIAAITALIQGGASPSQRDARGNTPIHYASGRLRVLRKFTSATPQLLTEIRHVVDLLAAVSQSLGNGADDPQGPEDVLERVRKHLDGSLEVNDDVFDLLEGYSTNLIENSF